MAKKSDRAKRASKTGSQSPRPVSSVKPPSPRLGGPVQRRDTGARYLVRGRVTGAAADYLVRAYDKDLRSEQCLGEASIDAQGNYEIRYHPSQFTRADKGSADLRIAVCNKDGRELLSSEIHFNAPAEAIINLDLAAGERGRSEYERYLNDLEAVLQGLALTELEDKDIDFLSGDTGIERQHIVWLRTAFAFAAKTGHVDLTSQRAAGRGQVPAALFYGWFREGTPDAWEQLIEQPIGALRAAALKAIEQTIIPAELEAAIEGRRKHKGA